MPFSLIAALAIVFFAVAFSLQNTEPITIHFFSETFQGPLVLILLTTLFMGILIHVLASMPARINKTRQINQLNKRITELEHAVTQKLEPPTS